MLRILSIIVSIFLFHNYAFAVDNPVKELPPMPSPIKEAPPIPQQAKEASPIDYNEDAKSQAPSKAANSTDKQDVEQHKDVIDEYKKFLSKVPGDVRDEIREYRKEVIKLNRQKISLYKQLSQESQDFLNSERDFKKRLPFRERRKIK